MCHGEAWVQAELEALTLLPGGWVPIQASAEARVAAMQEAWLPSSTLSYAATSWLNRSIDLSPRLGVLIQRIAWLLEKRTPPIVRLWTGQASGWFFQ